MSSREREPYPEHAIALPEERMSADVVIVGSGMGGGTLAWALQGLRAGRAGRRTRPLPASRARERTAGPRVHQEALHTAEPWFDGTTGRPFQPGVYYWVGGNTKLYGACLPRFRRSDFERDHAIMTASRPAWPFGYDDLEPFYGQAEHLYQVHGAGRGGPDRASTLDAYPFPALEHEPVDRNGSPSRCAARACTRSTCPTA